MNHRHVRLPANLMSLFGKMGSRRRAEREPCRGLGASEQTAERAKLPPLCRVWLVPCNHSIGEPTALEPAEPEPMLRHLAEAYVEAFNRAAQARAVGVRAVAVPIEVFVVSP